LIRNRIEKILTSLEDIGLDHFYITGLMNVRYATGFSGSAGQAVISKSKSYFLTDFRYKEQIKSQVQEYEHVIKQNMLECLRSLDILKGKVRIGFEADHVSVSELSVLKENFPDVEWVETKLIVERIAAVKDEEEIKNITNACNIIDNVFLRILEIIKPGVTEMDISAEISYQVKMRGSEVDPFEPIIASGKRSALPHGISTSKKIEEGDLIVLDFGATTAGYAGDMTRTIVVGEPSEKQRKVYEVVLGAQEAAIAAAKDGITGLELDSVARDYINDRKYGDYFGHALGHGLGLNVHTWPRVSEANKEQLLSNMVVTIEPGIYIPDFGGVRIEDDIVLNNGGCINLTKSTKEFISVG